MIYFLCIILFSGAHSFFLNMKSQKQNSYLLYKHNYNPFGKKYYEDEEIFYFLQLTEWLFYILQNKPKLEKNCRIQKKKYPYEKEYPIKYIDFIWLK